MIEQKFIYLEALNEDYLDNIFYFSEEEIMKETLKLLCKSCHRQVEKIKSQNEEQ